MTARLWIGALVLFTICCSGTANATTYYVRQLGSDAANGTSARSPFRTLTRAVRALNHGDQIVIGPGTYRESVFVAERFGSADHPISIAGDESGMLSGDAPGPVTLISPDPATPALTINRLRQATISQLTFRGPGEGLRIQSCHDVAVERCSFDGCARGIAAEGIQRLTLQSDVLTQCAIGCFLKEAVDSHVEHLSVAGSRSAGILILASGAGSILNCLLVQNNSNFVGDSISAPAWSSDYNVVSGDVGPWGDVPSIHNVYEWPSASGQDRHSVYVAPAFVAPAKWDLHVDPKIAWAGGLPGMNVGAAAKDSTAIDRDGHVFRARDTHVSCGAYDYPDPAPSPTWKPAGTLRGAGLRQSAGIYRADGSLVRTLLADAAGVETVWWDGLDDQGQTMPAGDYQLRAVSHDVRIVDDGNYGDNGNPLGTYNPDNPDRLTPLADGGFVAAVPYDEAGMPLRRFTSTGQPISAANLAHKDFMGISRWGGEMLGVVNKPAPELARLTIDCQRIPFVGGAEGLPLFAEGEPHALALGLAVIGNVAYVAIPSKNMVRAIDLVTGNKKLDIALPGVTDIAADRDVLWALSGSDVIAIDPATGTVGWKFASTLFHPCTLGAGAGRIAVVDRESCRVVVLDAADGKIVLQLGKEHVLGQWTAVSGDYLRDPRSATFLADGQLALAEANRIRIIDPATGKVSGHMLSNFMDSTVVHPIDAQYVYCFLGVFRVDPKSGAWDWVVESPQVKVANAKKGTDDIRYIGSPTHAVVLGGKPFIVYHVPGSRLEFYDVSDPLHPRLALQQKSGANKVIPSWAYGTFCFDPAGNIVSAGGNNSLQFTVAAFEGLDGEGNPKFDFEHPQLIGPAKDPTPRAMSQIGAVSADRKTGDIYYLAVTSHNNKMVPGWGADGTGVGRSDPAGQPLWFSPSSGGNYMSISAVNDGKQAWVLAGKSFGGQIDLFDSDGLRLSTGNWAWPTDYKIGFVDLRYGVQAYIRPDGKIGAYVEDDSIGRFARARIDGAETINRQVETISWKTPAESAGEMPRADHVAGPSLAQEAAMPKVAPLKVNGDWQQWADAGITPQVIILPSSLSFARTVPTDLLQTFRQGTALAAFAHDGENVYAYFLVADDTMHFDSPKSDQLWAYDGIELWLEEEQFGVAFTRDGRPALHKFRFHDRQGVQWKGSGPLPAENIWGVQLKDLSAHPLGRQLATITGASFEGKAGYVLMAKIPMQDVKLVGGIAGRGSEILPMTGKPGEIVRIAVVIGNITAWGREQDYKVNWPAGMMFSDPTRSFPFVLGK